QEVGVQRVGDAGQFVDRVQHRADSAFEAGAVAGGAVLRVEGGPLGGISGQRGRSARRRATRGRRGGVRKGGDARQDEESRYSQRQEEPSGDSHLGQIISSRFEPVRGRLGRE